MCILNKNLIYLLYNYYLKKNNNSIYITSSERNPELQNIYRNAIIKRYNRCIVSNMDNEICEASHIIPFAESKSFDINNGLLLNSILHKLFDKYYWSINPKTLCIEIFVPVFKNDIYNILKPYENIIKYLIDHYNKTVEQSKI